MMRDECQFCGEDGGRGLHGECLCVGHEYAFDGGAFGAGWQCKRCFEAPPPAWLASQERDENIGDSYLDGMEHDFAAQEKGG